VTAANMIVRRRGIILRSPRGDAGPKPISEGVSTLSPAAIIPVVPVIAITPSVPLIAIAVEAMMMPPRPAAIITITMMSPPPMIVVAAPIVTIVVGSLNDPVG